MSMWSLCAALLLVAIPVSAPVHAAPTRSSTPAVIAIVEIGGFNVLHSDFRLNPGERLRLPAGMAATRSVPLPTGSWDEQVAELGTGPLGNLEPDVLYSIAGSRIIGVRITERSNISNILDSRGHGTGTASAAAGRNFGTNPGALLVLIPDTSKASWEWLADQRWIDVVSASYATLVTDEGCPAADAIARIVRQGRLVFTAVGNGEQVGQVSDPSGVPEAYQVGGVDEEGRTYLNPSGQTNPAATPNRPYETGDRFSFVAADPDSLEGSRPFGGTSGAAPSTAGRAALLIQHARTILTAKVPRPGLLAQATKRQALPDSGPLADGDLTAHELTDLLHHVATPAEVPSPFRYLIEGFGGLNKDAIDLAKKILEGKAEEPSRPEEDQMHAQAEAARHVVMGRCG